MTKNNIITIKIMNNKFKNNLGGISVVLACSLLVLEVLLITGMTITFKTIGLTALITAGLFGAAFGIYCLVEWIKEKNKNQDDGE